MGDEQRERWKPWSTDRGLPEERPAAPRLADDLGPPVHEPVRRIPRWATISLILLALTVMVALVAWVATRVGARQGIAALGFALLLASWFRLQAAMSPSRQSLRLARREYSREGLREPGEGEIRASIRGFRVLTAAILAALGALAVAVAVLPS